MFFSGYFFFKKNFGVCYFENKIDKILKSPNKFHAFDEKDLEIFEK